MSSSTLTNLTQHPADRTPVDIDVTIALEVARRAWLEDGIPAGVRMLEIEHNFLRAMHGEDFHELPKAAALLGIPHRPTNRRLHLETVSLVGTRQHLHTHHGVQEDLTAVSTREVIARHAALHGGIVTRLGIRWTS